MCDSCILQFKLIENARGDTRHKVASSKSSIGATGCLFTSHIRCTIALRGSELAGGHTTISNA